MATALSTIFKGVRTGSLAGLQSSAPIERTSQLHSTQTPASDYFTSLELDSYQVALVPFKAAEGGRPSKRVTNEQLLILPWTWKDLVSHVRTEVGGQSSLELGKVEQFGEIRVDFRSMEVRRSNRLIRLTAMEFKVLKFFVSNPDRVITREELLNEVWGYDNYPCTRTVDNHVLRLRQKLETKLENPLHFRTVHGFGYKFTP